MLFWEVDLHIIKYRIINLSANVNVSKIADHVTSPMIFEAWFSYFRNDLNALILKRKKPSLKVGCTCNKQSEYWDFIISTFESTPMIAFISNLHLRDKKHDLYLPVTIVIS